MVLHLSVPQLSAPPDTTRSQTYSPAPCPRYFSSGSRNVNDNVNALTLHDYHNHQHQVTPAASVPLLLKRLKRKAAFSDLGAEVPLPTLQVIDLQSPPVNQQPAALCYFCGTTSTPQSCEAERPGYLVYGPQQPSQRVSSCKADRENHSPKQSSDFAYSVRSINHTPQRQSPYNVFGDPLPHTSVGSDNRITTASLFSDTSNFSLSRFPLPPHPSEPTPPSSSEGKTHNNEPKTPTVYHVRGASFDIINPHQSLRLQDIETPAEQDGECVDYFHIRFITERPNSKAAQMTPPRSNSHNHHGSKSRATPPRALFEDLPSAYNSITARSSRKYQQTALLSNNLPLQAVPVAAHEAPSTFEDVQLTDGHANSSSVPVSSSFKQRLSQVFRSKRVGHGQASSNTDTGIPLEVTRASTQDRSVVQSADTSGMRASVDKDSMGEVEFSRGNQLSSTSEANLSQYTHGHDGFRAPISREQSGSIDTPNLNPLKGASSQPAGLDRETSSNLILDAYNYDSAESNDGFRLPSRLFEHQMLTRPKSEPMPQADNTIGQIIEKYNRSHDSYPVQQECASHDNAHQSTGQLPKDFRKARSPVLRPTTSGLSQFDFDLDRRRSHPNSLERAERLPTRDVRAATIRALGIAPGAGPSIPLPSDPSWRLGPPEAQGLGLLSFSGISDTPSWTSSYGETHNLLAVSQQFPAVEFGRDAGANLPFRNTHFPSLVAPPWTNSHGHPGNRGDLSVPDSNHRAERQSQLTLEETITRDLRHLSGLSGLSSLSGSVYILNNANAPREQELGQTVKSASADQHVQEDVHETPSAKFLPIAAFPQSAVVPGYWRLSAAGRKALQREQPPINAVPAGMLSADCNEEGDDLDWETVHDTQTVQSHDTQTVQSHNTQSSFAEYSSSNTMDPFRNVGIHPGDARYQHTYRIHSPANSDEPVLLPSYDFRGGVGFPNRNALTTPSPALYTYNHPTPLPISHSNPFTSSPPQLTGSRSNAPPNAEHKSDFCRQEEGQNIPPFLWQRANLSIVHERTEEFSRPVSKNSRYFLGRQENGNSSIGDTSFDVLAMNSSVWLSTEPGPEVSTEAEDGSPRPCKGKQIRPRSAMLSSGLDPGLLHVLREGDPRMASSPLSITNSFAKLSYLGPRANVTGTPDGTGMREVGSSIVGSSSPIVPTSSPPVARKISSVMSTTLGHSIGPYSRSFPLVSPSSPLALYDEIHYGHTMKQSREYARPAVGSQKTLKAMTLGSRAQADNSMLSAHMRDLSERVMGYHAGLSSQTDRSLLPFTRSPSPPCLRPRPAPPSHASVTWRKKQQVSWVVFACCCVFPPLLLAYGHGIFDKTVSMLTHGDVDHLGRRQKRIAKWAGYSGTVVVVLAVVILFVVVRTVPNDLPR